MRIEKDKAVNFHYQLKDDAGTLLEDSSDSEPVLYLHGHGNIIPGLEQIMEGKQVGDKESVTLPPERGYGLRREDAVQRVPIKHLVDASKKLRVGMVVKVNTGEGVKEAVIIKVGKFNVDLDTNHPFAGKTLNFDIEIVEIRDASAEEVSHGHAHGTGGASALSYARMRRF